MQVYFPDNSGNYYNSTDDFSAAEILQMEKQVAKDLERNPHLKAITVYEPDETKKTTGLPLFVIDIYDKYTEESISVLMDELLPTVH